MSSRQRRSKHRQAGGKCSYCNRVTHLDGHPNDPLFATLDHVVPKSDPKSRELWGKNKVLACLECNRAKANRSLEEAVHLLTQRTISLYKLTGGKCQVCRRQTVVMKGMTDPIMSTVLHGLLLCWQCNEENKGVSPSFLIRGFDANEVRGYY